MTSYSYYLAVAAGLLFKVVSPQSQPLLSTIGTVPDLSAFSTAITASGGPRPNPAFEERFNSVLDRRNFTAFAPTNDAFAQMSAALGDALLAAPAYPLFESIGRFHIAEGFYAAADIAAASPIESIEGFSLSATLDGDAIVINGQAEIISVDTFASNGVIHQINRILNPYTAYFGTSNTTVAPAQSTEVVGTISDILLSDERLSTARDIFLALNPDLINNRLRLSGPKGPQIFAVPSSDAFKRLPDGATSIAIAPSNRDLSLLLFAGGLLDTTIRFENLDFSKGDIAISSVFTGINVTVSQATSGATFLNNAAVEAQVCGSNGCIWLIDRVLDPLYLAFGSSNAI